MQLARRLGAAAPVAVTEDADAFPVPARLNVNAASEHELTLLFGIGPAKAAAIVQYRQAHGDFGSLDELTAVRGIGPRIVEEIRPHAMCAPTPNASPI